MRRVVLERLPRVARRVVQDWMLVAAEVAGMGYELVKVGDDLMAMDTVREASKTPNYNPWLWWGTQLQRPC